ncbi:Bromodomain-containing protein [Syncephalis fuscata]|nr:Bromodomain-containing protein [Syncephalis fuscata]
MTPEQHRYSVAIVRQLKKHRDAWPFLQPVDPVALKIPDYPTIVKRPMDLSKVEQQLNNKEYTHVNDFISDVRLIFENCYLYNGRESDVSIMAHNVEEMFNNQIRKMPTQHAITALSPITPSISTNGAFDPPNSASLNDDMMPLSPGSRPKREIHPPARDLPAQPARRMSRPSDVQLKFCQSIVRELLKKSHIDYSFPFLEPVDWVAMKLPDYPTVIKHPMDLSTIRKKLEDNVYGSAAEFEADIRLMFDNCYRYNPEGTPVNAMGRKLQGVFEKKWAELPQPQPSKPRSKGSVSPSYPMNVTEITANDSDAVTTDGKLIAEMERHLEFMSRKLESMKKTATGKDRRRKSKTSADLKTKRNRYPGMEDEAPAPAARRKPNNQAEVTLDQKRELSENINLLSGDKLATVVTIIQQSVPHLKNVRIYNNNNNNVYIFIYIFIYMVN